jgi:hypothetical protein
MESLSSLIGSSSHRNMTTTEDRRALARRTKPIPCYTVEQLPPKDEALYQKLATAVQEQRATLIQEFVIPPCDAVTWQVQAGQLWRIVCSHGPQVADMNCWSLADSKEHFYSSKTRQMHATHLQTGDRLWSNMPFVRPLATIVYETIQYGWDDDGCVLWMCVCVLVSRKKNTVSPLSSSAGVHDVIGSRCDPYTHYLLTGQEKHDCCHSNLTRACWNANMTEDHVHDVLNVFMCTGFTKDTHQYFTKPSPVQVGDYIEFLAETDLVVAASTCPQGDVSMACGSDGKPVVFPLTVQVYELEEGFLGAWQPSQPSGLSARGLPVPRTHSVPSPDVAPEQDMMHDFSIGS